MLGSLQKITLNDLTIHETAAGVTNDDYFQITAQDTGKLVINAFFVDDVNLATPQGNLDIEVLDAAGNQIAISQTSDPMVAGDNNELIIIPVVGQQRYYLRVFSTPVDLPNDVPDAGPVQVPNVYDLEIENFAAPIPAIPDLDAASDSGMSNADDVTYDRPARSMRTGPPGRTSRCTSPTSPPA